MEHFDLLPKSEIQAGYGLIILMTSLGLYSWFSVFSCLFSKRGRQYFSEISRSWGMSFRVERIITTIMSIVCLFVYIFYLPFLSIEIEKPEGFIRLNYLKPRAALEIPREQLLGYEIYYYESEPGLEPDLGLIIHTKEGKRYDSYVPSKETAGNVEKAIESLKGFLPQLPSRTSLSNPGRWYQPWLDNLPRR